VKPFLDILNIQDTNKDTKECGSTRARNLSATAQKVRGNLDHKSKINFKKSHPIAFNPTFKENRVNRVRNDNPPLAK